MTPSTSSAERFARRADAATQDAADDAADSAQSRLRSTRHEANVTLERLSSKIDSARSDASALLGKAADAAQNYLDQGKDVLRDSSQQMRDMATRTSNSVVAYAKEEPVKAMLIAAVAAAAVIAIVAMSVSSDD